MCAAGEGTERDGDGHDSGVSASRRGFPPALGSADSGHRPAWAGEKQGIIQ